MSGTVSLEHLDKTPPTAPRAAVVPPPAELRRLAILLGALTAFGPLAIDMYLPAFPQITRDLGARPGAVQLTLAAYLLGVGICQMFHGPLADRFGRRAPLLAGCGLFTLGALVCASSQSIGMLMAARLLQALGGAAGPVVARAIVRDLMDGRDAARFYAHLMLVMGIAPLVAPWLGGQLLIFASWRWIFVVQAGFGLACCLAVALTLRETLPRERRVHGGLGPVMATFAGLLRHRVFISYVLISGFSSAMMFAYISGSPFVLIELHGVTPQHFGFFFGANALGLVGATQLNRWLHNHFTLPAILQSALVSCATVGVTLVICGLTGWGGLPVLAISLFLCLASIGLAGPNLMTAALSPFKKTAGSASALLGAAQLGMGGLSGAVVGLLHNGTSLPMTSVIAFCGLAGLAVWLWMPRPRGSGGAKSN